jgi:hypothetical protein
MDDTIDESQEFINKQQKAQFFMVTKKLIGNLIVLNLDEES